MSNLVRFSVLHSLALGIFALAGTAPAIGQERALPSTVGTLSLSAAAPDVRQSAHAAFHGEDGKGKDGPLSAVGMELSLLYHQEQAEGAAGVRALRNGSRLRLKTRGGEGQPRAPEEHALAPVSADGQFVTIDAVASGGSSSLLQNLKKLGLEGGARAGNVVSGRLPISAIKQAAALASLQGMRLAHAHTAAGSVGSEADTAHAAATARSNTGTDGSGQKVCALSDSYDTSDAQITASDDISSGDLPGTGNPEGRTTPVDVLDDGGTGGSDEGRAMLQLIHDIAPGAELGFHTAFGGLANFASGIQELANAGCTVIVDDVGYSTEPFYQDGPVANAVDDVVANDGTAYFSSAGNSGQDSYEAPFRNSGEPGVISASSVRHDFDDSALSTDTRQEITIEPGGTFQTFSFQWTDPSALVAGSSGPDTDLDIALVDTSGAVVAQSASDNISTGVPAETMEYTNDGNTAETLFLVIEKAAGPDPGRVKYVYTGGGYTIEEHDTLGPTVYGHPMAEGAMAVAAAPFYNTAFYNPNADPATLESFSSKGGLQIRFDQSGNRLSTPETREKPDVTGTDGIDNTFFGSDLGDSFFDGVDGDPHPNFFGTSAAAPNIAAIGALIRQARPGFTPSEVYERLENTAADITRRFNRDGSVVSVATGTDPWSGHGFVRADQAVPTVDNQRPVAVADTFKASQDSSLAVEAPGVLGNDSDPDGGPLEASIVMAPSDGKLTLQPDGAFEYVPDPGFVGTDRFRYAASDPGGLSDTSEVQVQVGEAEAPQITTRIVPSDTTVDSDENLMLTQTIENEATEVAELEVQVTDVPGFLTLESSVIAGGSGSVDSTDLALGPGAEAILTYSFEETVDAAVSFAETISHETNDPERSTIDLGVRVTVEADDLGLEIARSFGEASRPRDYQLVALPGQVDRPLGQVVQGEAGAQWQAFWDDGTQEDFLARFDGSETFRFGPGQGFWLAATEEWAVQDSVEAVSLRGKQAVSFPLHEGWNIVSNPLGADVAWEAVSQANGGGLQPAWAFDESFAQVDTFRSARSGRAYYFLNNGELDSLTVPVPEKSAPNQSVLAADADRSEKEGAIEAARLVARRGDSVRSSVRVGIAASGSDTRTKRNVVAPPARFSALSLRLVSTEGETDRQRLLAADYRYSDGTADGGHIYNLRLQSAAERPVEISASNLDALGGQKALLIEKASGESHYLQAQKPITIEDADRTALRLAVGTAGFVEAEREAALPDEVTFKSYPNPVRQQGTLEYALPEAGEVTLKVYDVLGREVATLEQGRKEAGRHQVTFKAERLSSGAYFGRLEAGGQSRTQKITVVR